VDTHKDVHGVAAIDGRGRMLGSASFATTTAGYRMLSEWLSSFGRLAAVGVEVPAAGVRARPDTLTAAGIEVVEVRRGKSDTIDAEEAARAVLSGDAQRVPKTATGMVECVRQLRVARRGAVKARGQAINSMHALVDTHPRTCAHSCGLAQSGRARR